MVEQVEAANSSPPVLACNLNAMTMEQRERYQALSRQIWKAVEETKELPDGYAFRLPAVPELCLVTAEFITLERLCCPFFTLAIELEQNGGPMWLRVTGREEVKAFLAAEMDRQLSRKQAQ